MSSKKPKPELKERVTSFAAMGYLAAIFYAQGEDQEAFTTIGKMAETLERDPEIARSLDPFLDAVCRKLGHELITIPLDQKDKGLH